MSNENKTNRGIKSESTHAKLDDILTDIHVRAIKQQASFKEFLSSLNKQELDLSTITFYTLHRVNTSIKFFNKLVKKLPKRPLMYNSMIKLIRDDLSLLDENINDKHYLSERLFYVLGDLKNYLDNVNNSFKRRDEFTPEESKIFKEYMPDLLKLLQTLKDYTQAMMSRNVTKPLFTV